MLNSTFREIIIRHFFVLEAETISRFFRGNIGILKNLKCFSNISH